MREIIYIDTDSITINYNLKLPIDSLKVTLINHLQNPKKDKKFPSKDEKKLISVYVDSIKDIAETKKLLLNIIVNINELDNKPNFSFMFENRRIVPKTN